MKEQQDVFDLSHARLAEYKPGDNPRSARRLNAPIKAINKLVERGFIGQGIRNVGTSTAVYRMRIKAVKGDYLECVTWDGTTEGPTVNVAKPDLLQRTWLDGTADPRGNGIEYVYTSDTARTATDTSDESTESQVVVPSFAVDDEILAVPSVIGGPFRNVESEDDPPVTIDWQMVTDARAWAKVSA